MPSPRPARLNCVALPILARDITRALPEVLALWADARFYPVLTPDTPRPHLMIVVNQANPDQLAQIQTLFQAFSQLSAAFSGVSAHSADLAGARDIYAPDGPAGPDEAARFGRKAGPNFLFQRLIGLAAPHCAPHGGFVLQLELDCLPVGPGWVEATGAVINDHPRAWVIGSLYAGQGLLGPDAGSHLNGNALYRAGDSDFQAFFKDIWMPRLLHQIGARPDLAYDWWWAVERFEADARANNLSWRLFQTYDHFFHNDPCIVNLAVPQTQVQAYRRIFDRVSKLGPAPVFLHGPAMVPVRRALLQQSDCDIFAVIDQFDPPENPHPPAQHPQPPATLPQDTTPSADQYLLPAAAALLALEQDGIAAWLDPDSVPMQAVGAARAALGAAHPACAHFDRVCAHVRARGT